MARRKQSDKPRLTAKTADKYALYQMSVQTPEHEVGLFDRAYHDACGRQPRVLREDFCGAFAVSCAWAAKRGRRAVGVDLDPEPLAWGRAHNLARLSERRQANVTLLQEDVRAARSEAEPADVLAAQNFSFWTFKTRERLRDYFSAARRHLRDRGVLVLDMMGGAECLDEDQEDVRRYRRGATDFTYVWEQARFDPITHDADFYIHFRFPDGSELHRAFEYHWRLWTLPEVRELLEEAGFARSHVYWDTSEEGDEERWRRCEHADPDPAWIAYVVAVK